MTQTTNYELNIVEGSDVVNPLVQTNPNFQKIDEVMKANETRTVGGATEVKSGTNHAISRTKANTNMFRFVATSDYRTGDTFSVDGNTVTASLVDGSNPKDRAFVIGTSVTCILESGRLTLVGCESEINIGADDVSFDPTGTDLTETNTEDVIKEVNAKFNKGSVSVEAVVGETNASMCYKLAQEIDFSKVTKDTTLYTGNAYAKIILDDGSTTIHCMSGYVSTNYNVIFGYRLHTTPGQSHVTRIQIDNSGTSFSNIDAENVGEHTVWTLYY